MKSNKSILRALYLGSLGLISFASYGMQQESEQKEENSATDFIFEKLREANENKWCACFSNGTVCNSYWKKRALDKREPFYELSSFRVELKGDDMFLKLSLIDLDEERKLRSIGTDLRTTNPNTMKYLEKKLDLKGTSDKFTRCSIADTWTNSRGEQGKQYLCKTHVTNDEFWERMGNYEPRKLGFLRALLIEIEDLID